MSTPAKQKVNVDRRGQRRAAGQASPSAAATSRPSPSTINLPIDKLFTVERAAYLTLFVLALAIRIGHLDSYPLDPGESTRALSAWQLVQGAAPVSWQEPLVILSAALSFFALGDNDVMARLVPVAVGSALVMLPWLLRMQIGRLGALLAALLLAVSPSFVFFSRTLSGDIFAAALSLGLLACIVRYVVDRNPQWAFVGCGLLALLLNTGAPGVSFLLAFLAYFALVAALGKNTSDYAQAWENLKTDRDTLMRAGVILIGGFVLIGTGFLGDYSGLKFPALSAWVSEFNLVPDGQPWFFHLQLLLGYEPMIFIFGVAGAAYYVYLWRSPQRRRPLGIRGLLVFWTLASMAISTLTGSKHGGQLLVPALPLVLIAGSLAGELIEQIDRRPAAIVCGLLMGSFPFLVFALLQIAGLTRKAQLIFWYEWMLPVLALILVATMVAASIAYGGQRGVRLAALAGLILLVGYSTHGTWRTAYASSEQETMAASLTSPSLVDAVQEIEELAASKFLGKDISIAVEPGLAVPARWYLRDYTSVQYVSKPQPGTQALVWRLEPPPEVGLQDYFARKVKVATSWSNKGVSLGEWWRWLIYREPFGTTKSTEMMLYLHK